MSPEQLPPPQSPEDKGEWVDYTIGVGTALGLFIASTLLVNTLDQNSVNGFMYLAHRLGTAFVISVAGAGAAYVTNRIRTNFP